MASICTQALLWIWVIFVVYLRSALRLPVLGVPHRFTSHKFWIDLLYLKMKNENVITVIHTWSVTVRAFDMFKGSSNIGLLLEWHSTKP